MVLSELTAVSSIDGRYSEKTKEARNYFSEFALIKYRVKVEIEYFVALCEMPLPQLIRFPEPKIRDMRNIVKHFSLEDAQRIKDIESTTNHDVKAVEYFIKEKMEELEVGSFSEFVHFGLTSQDVNNTAMPLMFKNYMEKVFFPYFEKELLNEINTMGAEWNNIPLLARTHGQAASPTTVGREFKVFGERLIQQFKMLKQIPFTCKFGGATGGLNAHYATYGAINWHQFADDFTIKKLNLERQKLTTQIEHYDFLAAHLDALKRINNILVDLCRDIWTYVSLDYFGQRIRKNEVGSSTMPHKVNPIDFENAEGNLLIANAHFEFLASKLPISRMQRDLTDSTVTRTLGVPMAHTLLAMKSLMKGLDKLTINKSKVSQDLDDNYVVVAEGIQSILRREGFPKPYEALKAFTRNKKRIGKNEIEAFIAGLDITEELKTELKELTPQNYIGVTNSMTKL